MVYSMTGYGKGNLVLHGKDITVEVKSVNHRYFEYSSRMSRFFSFLFRSFFTAEPYYSTLQIKQYRFLQGNMLKMINFKNV